MFLSSIDLTTPLVSSIQLGSFLGRPLMIINPILALKRISDRKFIQIALSIASIATLIGMYCRFFHVNSKPAPRQNDRSAKLPINSEGQIQKDQLLSMQNHTKLSPLSTKHGPILEIFSFLNLAVLGKSCCVSKKWKRLANEPRLWKNVIYKEIAFGNVQWAQCFGVEVVKDEDNKEELSSLPWKEFIEDCKKFNKIFPKKKPRDLLMLVRIPKTLNGGLTLNSFAELTKRYFPKNKMGYRCFKKEIADEFGNKSIDKSYWIVMTKDVLPRSSFQSYANQQQIVTAALANESLINYDVPETLESVVCIFSQFIFDQKTPIPWTSTRCKENIQGFQTAVGGFDRADLYIIGSDDNALIGVMARRKF